MAGRVRKIAREAFDIHSNVLNHERFGAKSIQKVNENVVKRSREVFKYWGTFTRTFLTMFEALGAPKDLESGRSYSPTGLRQLVPWWTT